MQPPPLDLHAYELATGAALAAAAARLAALPDNAPADAWLAALGLVAPPARADDPPRPIARWQPPSLGRSIEAWGLAAGLREVAFVTVAPDRVDAALAQFPGAHVERRERRVAIGVQDRWRDDRALGAPQVELFIAHDPALARRAAALQADDPTRHAAELGALLGYPPCCVAAFIAQRARHDNSLNRYLIAARTTAPGPWPWQLNELALRLIAFYPCRYDCARALAIADQTLATIAAASPALPAELARLLAATVVYVDHDHQAWLAPAPATHADGAVRLVGAGRGLRALGDRLAAAGPLPASAPDSAVPLVARFG